MRAISGCVCSVFLLYREINHAKPCFLPNNEIVFSFNSTILHLMSLAGSLTMNTEETNSFLVTGDADGLIKVWDITDYCVSGSVLCKDPPRKYRLF